MIEFVNKGYQFNSVAGKTLVLPVPDGATTGHRMIAMVGSMASMTGITDPAGGTWSKLAEYAPTSTLKTALYYRDVTADPEPGSYAWGWSGSGRNWGYVLAYAGVDLGQAPTFDALAGPVAAGAGVDSPSLALAAGDWLVTLLGGRENPGSDLVKAWSVDDEADNRRFDFYATGTGTTPKTTAAVWDSGRPLPEGSVHRTVTPSAPMQQAHVWSLRLAALAAGPDGPSSWQQGLPRA